MDDRLSGPTTDESDKKQLELSKKQGDAFLAAVKEMTESEADSGNLRVTDDYLVGYAIEKAEGMYIWEGEELVWKNPSTENAHIEVVVADRYDGRFIPGLNVKVTLYDDKGEEIGAHTQPYLWHPWLYHYGRNWGIAASGIYTLKIDVKPPPYSRHDKVHGKRHCTPVSVRFEKVYIETGQKLS